MRQIPIPKQLQIAEDYPSLVAHIKKTIEQNSLSKVLICTGEFTYDFLVKKLNEDLSAFIRTEIKIISEEDISKLIALEAETKNSSGSSKQTSSKSIAIYETLAACNINTDNIAKTNNAIIAIGGGKVLDFGKYLAAKCLCKFISIPTLISHDGVCSPVSVLRGKSLGATMPVALIVPLYIIERGSIEHIQAGIGDLIANLSAIADWQLAAQKNNEEIDDFAIMLSRRAAINIVQTLENQTLTHKNLPKEIQETILKDPNFLKALIENLALSGIAMSIAGNSRPCSGAEHLISHAIDQLYGHGTKAMHGIQVLIATLFLEQFRDSDLLDPKTKSPEESRLKQILKKLGFPTEFKDIGISDAELKSILELAPRTRVGRYSILNESLIVSKEVG